MTTTRREILKAIPAAAVVAAAGAVPAGAIPPVARSGKPRLRLGLAGYSLRDHLTGKLSPAMTLDDFIEKSAAWEVDAVELTSYYFPPDFTPAYVAGLKRHCHLLGLDVSTTPIRNTFTYPAGPEREKEIAHVKRWLDVAADLGSPAIRIFAGDAQKGQPEAEARRNCVESIEACADHAAQRGVFLALENHGGIVAEPDGLLEIVKAVKSDWFGVNLDTGNFHGVDPVRRPRPHRAVRGHRTGEGRDAGEGRAEAGGRLRPARPDAEGRGLPRLRDARVRGGRGAPHRRAALPGTPPRATLSPADAVRLRRPGGSTEG